MHDSPRIRRLRSDLSAMERLRSESSVLRFRTQKSDPRTPPQHYVVELHGRSLARERGPVNVRAHHEVEIKLGASYPRTMPELRWLTPIYHPNISEIGMVCLGGYGTHWVPSLNLDELCGMLWDMARYHNYDVRSPYNREAALWVTNQSSYVFPLDTRPLRDLRAALGRIEPDRKAAIPLPPPATKPAETPPQTAKAREHRAGSKAAPAPFDPGWMLMNPEPEPDPGSKAARYREFVRKFAANLEEKSPSASPREGAVPTVWEADDPANPDGVLILDMEVDLRPRQERSRPDHEEIVFID